MNHDAPPGDRLFDHSDLYRVLGIRREASTTEIRAAFIGLAKRHHPDLIATGSLPPGRLNELLAAYRTLSDAGSRAEHDRALDERERRHSAARRRTLDHLRRFDRRRARRRERSRRHVRRLGLIVLASCLLLLGGWAIGTSG